jgi:hypothetical protein
MNGKLAAWLGVVGVLITIGYASTFAAAGKTDTDELYHYSTAVGAIVEYAILLGLVLWIAGPDRELLALRRPPSWLVALALAAGVLIASYILIAVVLDPFLHGGREQGAVPTRWLPAHAGAYAANWLVVGVIDPFVEEVTYRGLGFSLLRRYGSGFAILAVGLLFAASHGLVQAFPELAVLGCALAWLRGKTESVYPGMLVHGAFNSIALAAVFFTTR